MIEVEIPWMSVPQAAQTIAGFQLLERQGVVRCTWGPLHQPFLDGAVIPTRVNGIPVFFDESDGYSWDPRLDQAENISLFKARMLENSFYFKRAFHSEITTELPRGAQVLPLGFSYQVLPIYYPARQQIRERMKVTLKEVGVVRRVTGASRQGLNYRAFEALPVEYDADGKAATFLFSTRLWDSRGDDIYNEEQREERLQMNRSRIAIVRALRTELGPRFIGGIAPSAEAARLAPDLMMPAEKAEKRHFVEQAKRASVVGVSMGLFKSIGWRFGELVAAARPVITDELYFSVGDDFTEGNNYLSFPTPDEAPATAARLLDDADLRARMRWANYLYYHSHLRPDVRVLRALEKVVPEAAVPRG